MTAEPIERLDGTDPELAAAAFALNQRAFASPDAAAARWTGSLAHSICVGVRAGDRVTGFARLKPYRQWFLGRAVPMAGVASVAVAPEQRGGGLAGRLTAALLPHAREAGLPLSVLYPASTALYRRLGWEIAGHHQWVRVPTAALRAIGRPDGVTLRPATAADAPAVVACYAELCRASQGLLERTGPFFESPVDADGSITVAEQDGRVTGYAITRLSEHGGHAFDLRCADLVAVTPAAQRAMWWLVGSFGSMAKHATLQTTPDDTLVLHLPEVDVRVQTHERWMARVVDAPAAIAARGWPDGVSVTADLDLVDPLAPWHEGAWRLVVDGGTAALERGGSGAVRLGPGGLAALYTSYADPFALHRAGLLDTTDERALTALRTAFAGPVPHLLDYF